MLEQTAVPGPAALRAGALPPTPTPAARALAAGDSSPVSLQGLLAAEGRWAVLFQKVCPVQGAHPHPAQTGRRKVRERCG